MSNYDIYFGNKLHFILFALLQTNGTCYLLVKLKSRVVLDAEDIRLGHVWPPVADMLPGGPFSCCASSWRPRAPANIPHDVNVSPEQRPVHVGHLVV